MIAPAAGCTTRVSSRITVVLPALFGPITPRISPGGIVNDSGAR
jgi:hypothetical protein